MNSYLSPRRELVEVLRKSVAGEVERLPKLTELEALRRLGDGRGEERVRCTSARGDLAGDGGREPALWGSFIESRCRDCDNATACELPLVLFAPLELLGNDMMALTGTIGFFRRARICLSTLYSDC